MSQERRTKSEAIPAQGYIRIRLASCSPDRSGGSDTESIHSCQGYETELVKDTSDTSSSPGHNIEYEITDTEETKGKFYLSNDSDDESIMELGPVFDTGTQDTLDIAVLADTSEENSTSPTSSSDVDPGLPRNDYVDFEKCVLCQTTKKDISYLYCTACFTWKKNFFPSRPKQLHKIKKRQRHLVSLNKDRSSPCFQENKTGNGQKINLSEDSGVAVSCPLVSESEDVVDGPSGEPSTSTPSTSSTSSNSSRLSLGLCRVCFLRPENGLFIHINIAHVYGCYSCAKKIWYHNGVCPICRRKVFKVAKLFV